MIVNQHFVPSLGLDLDAYVAAGDSTAVQHLIRYVWAIAVLAERPGLGSLLDLGCGDGYGCYAIGRRYPDVRVVGIDSDEGAIAEGRRAYALPNVELRVGNAMRWDSTIGADHYDCVISFDSIEHVEHRELYLEGVVEHLADDGCLMLSTPCGWPVNVISPDWPAHKIEYSSRSLYDLLARYFRTIRRPDDGSLPQLDVFKRLEGTAVPYLLQLNPVLCEQPIRVENPYPVPHADRGASQAHGITVFAGDWDGTGVDLPGLFDAGLGTAAVMHIDRGVVRWEAIPMGVHGLEWHAVAGDWTGRGHDTIGLYNDATGRLLLFERNVPGAVWREIEFGIGSRRLPVAGRWNADAADAVGLFDPIARTWHFEPTTEGAVGLPFVFGPDQAGLVPLSGTWRAGGAASVAVYAAESANFYFKLAVASGAADFVVNYGVPGNLPIVGDWDGDGIDTVGVYDITDGCFHLRNDNAPGGADAIYELPGELRSSLTRPMR